MPPFQFEGAVTGRGCPWKGLIGQADDATGRDPIHHATGSPAAIPENLRRMIAMMGSGRGPFHPARADVPPVGRAPRQKLYRTSISTNYEHLHEIPFDLSKYPQMNTALLDPKQWMIIDDQFGEQLALKRQLFAHNRARVFQVAPEAFEASLELLERLVEFLPREYPHVYRRDGDLLINEKTNEAVNVVMLEDHPLAIAGQLVQEDLNLVIVKQDAAGAPELRLGGSCVCFPTGWSVRENLDRTVGQIHKRVPRYKERLEKGVDHFLLKLSPEHPMMRRNWFIYDNPTLAQPRERRRTPPQQMITEKNAGTTLFLRSERETLIRLPKTNAIVFSIREHVYPLERVKEFKDVAEKLIDAIEHLPDHALEPYAHQVTGYLRS